MIRVIADLDDELMAWKVHAQERWEEMKNHPSMEHLNRRVQLLGHDYRRLMAYMGDRVPEFTIPEEYVTAIYNARDVIADGLSDRRGKPPGQESQGTSPMKFTSEVSEVAPRFDVNGI